jgi:hypothetical protein
MKKVSVITAVLCLLVPFSAYSVEFTLFGDVVFMNTDAEDESSTFNLGGFNLTASQEIGADTFVNAEVVFEDSGHGFEVDVERFSVSRTFGQLFTIGAGRFHTPLGMWNQYFHHGSLLQDTITRPFFLEYEDAHGGIFPNHLVGLLISGESESWGYQFGYGNSNGISTVGAESHPEETALEVINNSDPSDEKSIVLRFNYKPGFLLDEMGVFFMHNHVIELGEAEGADVPFVERGEFLFEQKILGFDLRYNGEKFYHLFEYFHVTTDDNPDIVDPAATLTPNTKAYGAHTFYYQLGFHATEKLSLIGRFETMDYESDATYFELLHTPPQDRYVFAINYKIQESNSVRFEFSRASIEDEDNETSMAVQWFFILL